MKPFDLQVNGYAGVDFNAISLDASGLHQACEALAADGVDAILATLITDDLDRMRAKLRNLVRLREADPLAARLLAGFHLEGPFLHPEPGYIGAHPAHAVRPASPDAARSLLDAGSGLVRLVTLAPEHDAAFSTIRFLAAQGVTVSAGHCNPSLNTLQGAIEAGLTLITHFGNACPVDLPRHDNILQRILHLRDHLRIGFIADGVHIPFFALRNYLDLVGTDRAYMVTDAISAARLGPGRHEISGLAVEVDDAGTARRPGSPNLAGSTVTMPRLLANLRNHLGCSESEIAQLVDQNPRDALIASAS